ncbi:hypothetical protein KXJ69_01475 [Aureisphaera sp. CAU 1614]|uniref:Tail specific protease domain-containing protein n=1 Tax=Halomarinibacterium sedimenti TaxID=2857106 RepID=A0A9X1JUL5_9FLAO|nr:S41 family peptidase [Halomarinibacterium sedimenti]MBW2936755.1 hypothetical protein [Halomarinibacterium sedimenti]
MKKYVFKYLLLGFTFLQLSFVNAQQNRVLAWQEDIQAYQTGLEVKHIDVYNSVSKQDFESELTRIKESVLEKTDFEIMLDLMRLTRRIGDGHTSVSLRNIETHNYPFEVRFLEGHWRVVKVAKEHKNLLKTSLIKIEGIPINEVVSKVSEVAQFVENEYSEVIRTGEYIPMSELLYALHITKNKNEAKFTFIDENKREISLTLNPISNNTSTKETDFEALTISVPEITKPEDSKFDYLWYTPIKDTKAIYIKFKGYPSFDEMLAFGETLVGYIMANAHSKAVIDLRGNGGGDLYVGVVLAYALNLADTIDWKNGVYIMCDHITFSAATSNTALFKRLLNGKVVGEPTGSNPTGYQDMATFELPNSKLVITYSKRYFKISDTVTQGVQPDVLLHYQWGSFAKGRDNMLHWVIQDLKK